MAQLLVFDATRSGFGTGQPPAILLRLLASMSDAVRSVSLSCFETVTWFPTSQLTVATIL